MKFLFKFYERKYKSHHRSIMRGYRYLKNVGQLDKIDELKKNICANKLNLKNRTYHKLFFFNIPSNQNELVIRQYLISKKLCLNFNEMLLSYFGNNNSKFSYAIPFEWILRISKEGIRVNFFISKIKFLIFSIFQLIRSFIYFLYILRNSIKQNNLPKNAIYVDSVPIKVIKDFSNKYNIINWLKQYTNTKNLSLFIDQNLNSKNIYKTKNKKLVVNNPFCFINSKFLIIRFILWYFMAFISCLVDTLFYEGYMALIIRESIKCKVFEFNKLERNIKYAFFNNSQYFYKPIWTYLAEKNNVDVIFYFYSTNNNQLSFKTFNNLKYITYYGWDLITWKNFLVWNKYQADFVKLFIKKPNTKIVGPIPYQDSYSNRLKILNDNINSITLFDEPPFRDSFYQTFGEKIEYEIPEIAIKFISNIIDICDENNLRILFKTKRFSKKHHKKYISYLKNISYKKFHLIDSNVSAFRLINSSIATISAPYASTSEIAKSLSIPSCYYDPTGMLIATKMETNGIFTIRSKKELSNWIKSLI